MSLIHWPDGRVEEKKFLNDSEFMAEQYRWLKILRDDYSNDIPSEILNSASPNPKYKVRAGWWATIDLRLNAIEKRGLLSDNLIRKYHQVMDNYGLNIKNNNGLTQESDIVECNVLLNDIIDSLENRLNV